MVQSSSFCDNFVAKRWRSRVLLIRKQLSVVQLVPMLKMGERRNGDEATKASKTMTSNQKLISFMYLRYSCETNDFVH